MIYYDIQESTFCNRIAVACTKQGICAILLDRDGNLNIEQELQTIFPHEELYFGSVRSMNYAFNFIAALENNQSFDKLNIDIQTGTPFQRLVWQALTRIPTGTTITYSGLAANIGMPRSVRAVASACGKNPVSVIIPCHRVIPKSGGIGKYRWGSEMKNKLIAREKITK